MKRVKQPVNWSFWKYVIEGKKIEDFINKGNERQQREAKQALKYYKHYQKHMEDLWVILILL